MKSISWFFFIIFREKNLISFLFCIYSFILQITKKARKQKLFIHFKAFLSEMKQHVSEISILLFRKKYTLTSIFKNIRTKNKESSDYYSLRKYTFLYKKKESQIAIILKFARVFVSFTKTKQKAQKYMKASISGFDNKHKYTEISNNTTKH